jgi:lipopolysaccharide heptosyltransferase II
MTVREFHPESIRSILVVRLYFVGDVLLSTPVLAALRQTFPAARITVLIKKRAREILFGNPNVDEVMEYDAVERYHSPRWSLRLARELRRRRFDLAVDLTGDLRSSWLLFASDPGFRVGVNHAGLGFLLDRRIPYRADGPVVDHLVSAVEAVGARLPGEAAPRMYLSEEERVRAHSILSGVKIESGDAYVALAPGANWPFRRWPAERFGQLAAFARDGLGLPSVVLGSPDDGAIGDAVVGSSSGAATSLVGRTTLRTLAAVSAGADAFVGNDSGPLHVAASVGTPVVGLFGPNTPERFAPRGAPSRVIWPAYACSPCSQKRCVRPEDPCMSVITVDEVYRALEDLVREGRAS